MQFSLNSCSHRKSSGNKDGFDDVKHSTRQNDQQVLGLAGFMIWPPVTIRLVFVECAAYACFDAADYIFAHLRKPEQIVEACNRFVRET